MIKFIPQIILDIFFPIKCFGCEVKHTFLCKTCITLIPESTQVFETTTTSVFDYRNEIMKKVMWALKYRGNKEIGKIFAIAIYDKILEELADENLFSNFCIPLLVPIPISKKRLKERGFNQSELLAKEIFLLDSGASFTLTKNVLYKIKDTPSQVSIKDKKERLRNLRGCFAVKNQEAIRNKNIILIDDVTTTGATIAEAKKTLLDAGAKRVIAFTVAH